jgi:hypothetical protein
MVIPHEFYTGRSVSSSVASSKVLSRAGMPALRKTQLVWKQNLVWTLDFLFRIQEFFAPWFAYAFGTLVDGIADGETVVAGAIVIGARKLLTSLAGLKEFAFDRAVLVPQFFFANDAHGLLLPAL